MAAELVAVTTQFPWAALITACTGIISALGGAFLANRFVEKRWREQIKLDKEKEHIVILRSKGEELFLSLKRWQKEAFFTIQGRINEVQGYPVNDEGKKFITSFVNPDTHGKVDVIVAVYFPDFLNILNELHCQISKVNDLYKKSEGRTSADIANLMIHESQVYERLFEIFYRKIIQKINSL